MSHVVQMAIRSEVIDFKFALSIRLLTCYLQHESDIFRTDQGEPLKRA